MVDITDAMMIDMLTHFGDALRSACASGARSLELINPSLGTATIEKVRISDPCEVARDIAQFVEQVRAGQITAAQLGFGK